MGVRLIDHHDLDFQLRGEDKNGQAFVTRALPEGISQHMGIGFAKWEGAEVSWTVLYNEVIIVLEGCLNLKSEGVSHTVISGQMLWISKGTTIVYSGHAVFAYAVYPGNWKQNLQSVS